MTATTTTTLLQLNASLFSTGGQSSLLSTHFIEAYQARHPDTRVIRRDLGADAVPHLDAERFGAFTTPVEARTPAQQAVIAYSDTLIDELRAADHVVLGLPMYNFGVPSQLKAAATRCRDSVGAGAAAAPAPAPPCSARSESRAHFDHVARAGVTFRYTATGAEGLLKGKKATVFATRGGLFAGTPMDTQTSYVRDFLRFIGIEDVEFVYAEGLALGEVQKSKALASANEALAQLAA